MNFKSPCAAFGLPLVIVASARAASGPGLLAYQVPAAFPKSLFSSYYQPVVPTQEPQPVILDEILHTTYPFDLTNPEAIPTVVTDPVYFPEPTRLVSLAEQSQAISSAVVEVRKILTGAGTNCTKCIETLKVGKDLAGVAPEKLPQLFVQLCRETKFKSNSTCAVTYGAENLGQTWTQVLAFADVGGQDGRYICNSLSSTFCPAPGTNGIEASKYFPKPKPKNPWKPEASGKRVKVLHLSDMHLDPRYFVTAEANCTSGLCCRTDTSNHDLPAGQISEPAPLWGAFQCDSPYALIAGVLQAIAPLTGTSRKDPFAFTIYTGDLVSHDPSNEIDHAYVAYTETALYGMLHSYIPGPVYAALGNHDTSPVNIDSPHALPGSLADQFSWNYYHVAGLWQNDGWLDERTAKQARLHYGAYSVETPLKGLRIITINTDFWYRSNVLNFINTTDPDVSGTLRFLVRELQAAEDAQERCWIVGHVPSGWDGTNALPNPSDLFYQIVDRYSATIASVMFGHTHEDENMIFYANNGSARNSGDEGAQQAQVPGYLGPSVTPLTNLNTGFRMYEIDTGTFDVHESYTFFANASTFPSLSGAGNSKGPTFRLEYSAREAYGGSGGIGWPSDAPLNATFWHEVTRLMERNRSIVELQNTFQGKSSVLSPNCSSDACAKAKVYYLRSGSVPLARDCIPGFGSVQSAFTGKS